MQSKPLKNPPTMPDLSLLPDLFRKYPQIQAVYAFGSVAEGITRFDSDLDLAIVPLDKNTRNIKLDLLADLAEHGFNNVDLVFLDTDDIVLKYQAIRLNLLIYQTDDFDRAGTYSLIIRQYLDFIPYLKVQREAYKRSILDG